MTWRVITIACHDTSCHHYDEPMSRWQPDARDRLERAALDLFSERGFDRVTVPEITARAGLTTRTFHRHFADKREVLFADAGQMPALAARLIAGAPPGLGPIGVVAHGLPVIASAFEGRLGPLKQRKAVIDGHDGLRERELRKMEQLTDSIAGAFRSRGVDQLAAALVAELAVSVVKVALRRWLESDGREPLTATMTSSLRQLGDAFAHQEAG
jgi:AcrR family transcriptional regulator